MTDVGEFVERKLKLTVNTAKSRVDRLAGCVFLGCQIERKQIRWSKAAVEEFRAKGRQLTGRTWGVSMERRLKSLNRYVSGWFGYYRISRTWGAVLELDKWIRRRVRPCGSVTGNSGNAVRRGGACCCDSEPLARMFIWPRAVGKDAGA